MEKLGAPSNQQQGSKSAELARIDPNNDNPHLECQAQQPELQEGPTELDLSTIETGDSTSANINCKNVLSPQVNAVRVLFKDQRDKEQALPQQQPQQSTTNLQQQSDDPPQQATPNAGFVGRPTLLIDPQLQATIVSANRRLIERQIEAIQEADSCRWNFDFRACRPLGLADHRYIHLSDSSATNSSTNSNNDNNNNNTDVNCRPLSDRNSNIASRLINNQQRWVARATRGNHPNRSDHNKPEED